jgi:hypothetical protein
MYVALKMWLVSMMVAGLKAGGLKMHGNYLQCWNWKVYEKRIEYVYFVWALVRYLRRFLQHNRTTPGHFWICFSSHVHVILLHKTFRVLVRVARVLVRVARGRVAMLVGPTVSIHSSKYGPCRGRLHLRHVLFPCSFLGRPREYQVYLPEYLYLSDFGGDLVEPELVRSGGPLDLCAASKMLPYLTLCADLDLENYGVTFEGLFDMADHSTSSLDMLTLDSSNLYEEVVILVYGG